MTRRPLLPTHRESHVFTFVKHSAMFILRVSRQPS